jgi:broad specificity phosphatase PhoE
MKIYVTRHGESETNAQNLCCGRWDVDLTEEGIKQAGGLAAKLANCKIDAIISSPLKRAKKTAEIIAKQHGLDVLVDDRLTEMDYGIYEGGLRTAPEFRCARVQFVKRIPNGESNFQVGQRIFNAMDDIKKRYQNQTVLIVGHAGICRMIGAYLSDMSDEEFCNFKSPNCDLTVYETE